MKDVLAQGLHPLLEDVCPGIAVRSFFKVVVLNEFGLQSIEPVRHLQQISHLSNFQIYDYSKWRY